MIFTTPVHITPSEWPIRYEHRILLLGSCFSDNIAERLRAYSFRVTSNPTGTLYNPISVARHIEDVPFDVAIVTFGTAWVYIDKSLYYNEEHWMDAVVDNCEKRPATDFIRRRMTVDEMVRLWQPIVERHTDKRFIFTVSPIRHIKDGLHENQLSKSTLLLAIETLLAQSETSAYFPSYELLLDELRDYRFYAADMMHPSSTAVDYIWERFCATYLYEPATQEAMNELHQWWLDKQHRPLHPDSEEWARFQQHVAREEQCLRLKYPWI